MIFKCSSLVLAYNIRFYRNQVGLTQEQLAKSAGINYRIFQTLESGKANPTLKTVDRLADFFKIATCDLLRLSKIRITVESDSFLASIKREFANFEIATAVRDLKGTIFWRNIKVPYYEMNPNNSAPFNLLEFYPEDVKDLFRLELELENKGIFEPYWIASAEYKSTNKEFFRSYPIGIIPKSSQLPEMCIVFIFNIKENYEEQYYTSCAKLLELVLKLPVGKERKKRVDPTEENALP